MTSLTRIQLSTGLIEGRLDNDLVEFRGVPFAEPPVGALRWVAPQAARPWQGVLETKANGPISPQTASRAFEVMGAIDQPQSEACLTLNIWVPSDRTEPIPVLIWLHGGGFSSGSASLPWYDGGRLAREQGVIVVGVNYRVGALGYLSIPDTVPGNLGLLDLLFGVSWVKREIAAFGGDPDTVTVMGQSGGAHSIASLLTTPEAKGLFRRAILQSPPLSLNAAAPRHAATSATAFLDILGIRPDDEDLIGALQRVPLQRVLDAQNGVAEKLGRITKGDVRPVFMPVDDSNPYHLDGRSLAEAAGTNAAAWGVDLLVGWTRDEANLFLGGFPHIRAMNEEGLQSALTEIATAQEVAAYLPSRDQGGTPGERFMTFVTRQVFAGPTATMAETAAKAGGTAHVYQFDWASPLAGLGACHCLELPFTFGNLSAWPDAQMLAGASAAELEALAKAMTGSWGRFARTGDPGFPGWSASHRPVQHFDATNHLEE